MPVMMSAVGSEQKIMYQGVPFMPTILLNIDVLFINGQY